MHNWYSRRFELRLTKNEREALEEQAKRVGLNASEYLRWMIHTHDPHRVVKSSDLR